METTKKHLRPALTALWLLALCAATSSAQFEGTVRMIAVSDADGDSDVVRSTLFFRGKDLAAVIEPDEETGEEGAKFILRGDRGVMWIVIEKERKVIEIPISVKPRRDTITARDSTGRAYTLEPTGKRKTLAGFDCEEWKADEGEGKTARIWVTAELGGLYAGVVKWFDEMSMESQTGGDRWERELAERGLFPLKVLRLDEGELTESEEVVLVERKKIPSSVFEFPGDYTREKVDLNFDTLFDEMMKDVGTDSTGGGAVPEEDPRGRPVDREDSAASV